MNQYGSSQGLDHTMEFDPQDIEANKVVCILSYLSILFFLPLVACPNSPYGRFHANQALLLFIVSAVLGAAAGATSFIPVVGAMVSGAAGLVCFILMVVQMVNTGQGKAMEFPIFGNIRLIK